MNLVAQIRQRAFVGELQKIAEKQEKKKKKYGIGTYVGIGAGETGAIVGAGSGYVAYHAANDKRKDLMRKAFGTPIHELHDPSNLGVIKNPKTYKDIGRLTRSIRNRYVAKMGAKGLAAGAVIGGVIGAGSFVGDRAGDAAAKYIDKKFFNKNK